MKGKYGLLTKNQKAKQLYPKREIEKSKESIKNK